MTSATCDKEICVLSDRSRETPDEIRSTYRHERTIVDRGHGKENHVIKVEQKVEEVEFILKKKIQKTGVLIVGLGGNNGCTYAAVTLANQKNLEFQSREGPIQSNWYGSVAESSTIYLGKDSENNTDVHIPFHSMLPMLRANDIVVHGWDISDVNLYDACDRAKVLEYDMKKALQKDLQSIVPMKGIYRKSFIASNQENRVNNALNGTSREQVEALKKDILRFKAEKGLDNVIVLWSANTERFSEHLDGVHDTAKNLLNAVSSDHEELAPSLLYCIAAIETGCAYINGSPQNTFCDGLIQYAEEQKTFLAGNDFKTGQTKVKSVLADFLVKAGLKLASVISYNHLGNNDGKNLSSQAQFRSKEISKSSVINDVIASNPILYKSEKDAPDHCVVIKYLPYVGDSKRALDEYICEGLMKSKNTISLYNTCEDSMLAVPLMADLVIFTEFCTRLTVLRAGKEEEVDTILSLLSLFLKAPEVRKGHDVINGFYSQRASLTNLLRIVRGLPVEDHLRLDDL